MGDMLNRVMTKDNIALAALLQTKEACWENGVPPDPKDVAQPILVCSAHIHWDPEFCDVKLIQSMMLMDSSDRSWKISATASDQDTRRVLRLFSSCCAQI